MGSEVEKIVAIHFWTINDTLRQQVKCECFFELLVLTVLSVSHLVAFIRVPRCLCSWMTLLLVVFVCRWNCAQLAPFLVSYVPNWSFLIQFVPRLPDTESDIIAENSPSDDAKVFAFLPFLNMNWFSKARNLFQSLKVKVYFCHAISFYICVRPRAPSIQEK